MHNDAPSIRILHLEDDANDAQLIKGYLTTAGVPCEIRRVDSGPAFEAALAHDVCDLILVDYSMPGYDGRRAVLASRERQSDVPVIVVSGMTGEEAAVECLHLGAVDYVLKHRPARFVPAVQRALREAEDRRKRLQAEASMREAADLRIRAAEQFRLAIEAAPAGMILTDAAGRIRLVNAEAERLFGYPRSEMLDRPIEILIPPRYRERHAALRAEYHLERHARAMGAGRELFGLPKHGAEVPIEIRISPLDTPEGAFVLCSVVDITERKSSEARLRGLNAELERRVLERTAQLRERESLLQEIHHRVKNNLQVVSSLINMQMRKLGDSASRVALAECESRVQAMARIHEMLYLSKNYARVPFGEYVRKLATEVVSLAGMPDAIHLQLELDNLALPVESAIPCGLILNELLSNCLKHAFPGGAGGRIGVALRRQGGDRIQLSVSDNGIGLPTEPVLDRQPSFGSQLIETLVSQLGGTMEIIGRPGTTVHLSFPADALAIRANREP